MNYIFPTYAIASYKQLMENNLKFIKFVNIIFGSHNIIKDKDFI